LKNGDLRQKKKPLEQRNPVFNSFDVREAGNPAHYQPVFAL